VRFGSARSSCSRFGDVVEPVLVVTAVAASAAFPLLLPAIEHTFTSSAADTGDASRFCSVTVGFTTTLASLCSNPDDHRSSLRRSMTCRTSCRATRGGENSACGRSTSCPAGSPDRLMWCTSVRRTLGVHGCMSGQLVDASAGSLWHTWACATTGSPSRLPTSCPGRPLRRTAPTSPRWLRSIWTGSRPGESSWFDHFSRCIARTSCRTSTPGYPEHRQLAAVPLQPQVIAECVRAGRLSPVVRNGPLIHHLMDDQTWAGNREWRLHLTSAMRMAGAMDGDSAVSR
jgi:hypothetical protein